MVKNTISLHLLAVYGCYTDVVERSYCMHLGLGLCTVDIYLWAAIFKHNSCKYGRDKSICQFGHIYIAHHGPRPDNLWLQRNVGFI